MLMFCFVWWSRSKGYAMLCYTTLRCSVPILRSMSSSYIILPYYPPHPPPKPYQLILPTTQKKNHTYLSPPAPRRVHCSVQQNTFAQHKRLHCTRVDCLQYLEYLQCAALQGRNNVVENGLACMWGVNTYTGTIILLTVPITYTIHTNHCPVYAIPTYLKEQCISISYVSPTHICMDICTQVSCAF